MLYRAAFNRGAVDLVLAFKKANMMSSTGSGVTLTQICILLYYSVLLALEKGVENFQRERFSPANENHCTAWFDKNISCFEKLAMDRTTQLSVVTAIKILKLVFSCG